MKHGASLLSHILSKMTRQQQWAMLDSRMLQNIFENPDLPNPQEQFENLILWLGETLPNIGATVEPGENTISRVGVVGQSDLAFLISQAINDELVNGYVEQLIDGSYSIHSLQLTLDGWRRFEELQRGLSTSQIAFMAMQFGDRELDLVYRDYFKTAVADAGFLLKRVDEGQPAGLIDDRLRVEIRQSQFLIADLTHQNRGAYWEAGYAEGLGKPVIYTCRKDVFEDKSAGTHFDTNHHLTVTWDVDKLEEAVERLKATIRATLPDKAKFESSGK